MTVCRLPVEDVERVVDKSFDQLEDFDHVCSFREQGKSKAEQSCKKRVKAEASIPIK